MEKSDLEQKLIQGLKEKGAGDQEVQKLIQEWTIEEEGKVGPTPADSTRFNIKRARVYFEGGYVDEALKVLEDARIQAFQQNEPELKEEIEREMDRMEAERSK